MNEVIQNFKIPLQAPFNAGDLKDVEIVHILESGEPVDNKDFEKYKTRFAWVDTTAIVQHRNKLMLETHPGKKSRLLIYEKGHRIYEEKNVDHDSVVNFQNI